MAKQLCPFCSKLISPEEKTCPKCNRSLSPGWAAAQEKKTSRQMKIVFVVILIFAGSWLYSYFRSSDPDPCGGSWDAYFISEQFVKKRLRAPSTASFAGYNSSTVTKLSCKRWRVWSYVDAQNGFGAKIRTRYVAILEFDGKKTWKLESLNMK